MFLCRDFPVFSLVQPPTGAPFLWHRKRCRDSRRRPTCGEGETNNTCWFMNPAQTCSMFGDGSRVCWDRKFSTDSDRIHRNPWNIKCYLLVYLLSITKVWKATSCVRPYQKGHKPFPVMDVRCLSDPNGRDPECQIGMSITPWFVKQKAYLIAYQQMTKSNYLDYLAIIFQIDASINFINPWTNPYLLQTTKMYLLSDAHIRSFHTLCLRLFLPTSNVWRVYLAMYIFYIWYAYIIYAWMIQTFIYTCIQCVSLCISTSTELFPFPPPSSTPEQSGNQRGNCRHCRHVLRKLRLNMASWSCYLWNSLWKSKCWNFWMWNAEIWS